MRTRRRLHVPVPCRKLRGRPGTRPARGLRGQRRGHRRGHAEAGPQRLGELLAAAEPVLRRLGQGPGQHCVGGGQQVRALGEQRPGRLGQVRVDDRHALVTREHGLAAEQLEGRAGERVLVGLAADRLALDLLRRGVVGRAEELPGGGDARRGQRPLAEPEVGEVHVIGPARPGVQQHVRGLDVPVHQARRVRRVQRRGDRRDDRGHLRGGQLALAFQQALHIPAGHVPHRDVQHPRGLPGLVDRDDVRIVDRRRSP